MKKLLIIAGLILLFSPWASYAQLLYIDNLSLTVGAEYPTISVNITSDNLDFKNYNKITVRPHVQLSYAILEREDFNLSVYSGYSQLGGKKVHTINEDNIYEDSFKEKDVISMRSAALGIKGIWKFDSFGVGPIVSGKRLFDYQIKHYSRHSGKWDLTNTTEKPISRVKVIPDYTLNAGFSLYYDTGSPISFSFEGMFGLHDIYNEQKLLGEAMRSNKKWHPRSFRLMVGYSF